MKYIYWLEWWNGPSVQKGPVRIGTESDMDEFWNGLHESAKQMCSLCTKLIKPTK